MKFVSVWGGPCEALIDVSFVPRVMPGSSSPELLALLSILHHGVRRSTAARVEKGVRG